MPYNSLSNCVSSISASVSLLDDSINTLDDAAKDLARLKKVLSIKKVFGLVPESDLENAKQNIKSEVQPQIGSVLVRIRRELNTLERKKMNLIGKIDLQEQRLDSARGGKSSSTNKKIRRKLVYRGDVSDEKLTRLMLLQNKKDRLKYSLSRHNLQSQRARLSKIPSLQPQ
ncbi:DASH complex subunit Spc19p [[Candida] railenensis]|uniref:DASH complex subunit SPC19 n=1 Tax=[Candida] railenensis TaxID=45579 RepID=A0A9P0VZD0_9ASCO|nr:DASH complex subunit Spc19p [[Candida] railenensis]